MSNNPSRASNGSRMPRWWSWLNVGSVAQERPTLYSAALLCGMLLLIIVARVGQSDQFYQGRVLLVALNLLFLSGTSLLVGYLISRSVLARPTPGLLLMLCGVTVWGLATVLAPSIAPNNTNHQVTIYNTCACAAALLHLAGVALRSRAARQVAGFWLTGSLGGGCAIVGLIIWWVKAGGSPRFFDPATGPTLIRQAVLGAAIGMFAATGLVLLTSRSRSAFMGWYGLALAFLAAGLAGVMLNAPNTLGSWISRATQWIGGLYMLRAAISAAAETRSWEISLEEALSQANRRSEALLETVGDGFVSLDGGLHVLYANPAAGAAFCAAEHTWTGRALGEILPGDVFDSLKTNLLRALSSRTLVQFEMSLAPRADRWLECRAYPLPEGVSMLVRDVTEARAIRERTLISERRFREAVEHLPAAYTIFDAEMRLQYANETACRHMGFPAERLIGRRVEKALPPDVVKGLLPQLSQAVATGCPQQFELNFCLPEGTPQTHIVHCVPLKDSAGVVREVLGIAFDITERKRMEDALRAAQQELKTHADVLAETVARRTAKLEETVGEMEQFSYTIAHDLRAPLRAMQGYAQMVLDSFAENSTEEVATYLARIQKASNRMDRLITGALDYSKAGKAGLERVRVDVSALLRGLVETYPNLGEDRADIMLDETVPPVLGDEAALTQCFSNLLGNAVKFVKPGTRPKVEVTWEDHGARVRISVRDNGIGIPVTMQDNIFMMFTRLNTQYEGTGIGLAIVRKVVERIGGRIGLESQAGAGTRFWVDLERAP